MSALGLCCFPVAEKGRDYVSTHGFSEIMCLHLWRCADWWRRSAHCRYDSGAGAEGREEEQCPPDRARCSSSQGEARSQDCADNHDDVDMHASRGDRGKPGNAADRGAFHAFSTF